VARRLWAVAAARHGASALAGTGGGAAGGAGFWINRWVYMDGIYNPYMVYMGLYGFNQNVIYIVIYMGLCEWLYHHIVIYTIHIYHGLYNQNIWYNQNVLGHRVVFPCFSCMFPQGT